jgi:hypothetical protein
MLFAGRTPGSSPPDNRQSQISRHNRGSLWRVRSTGTASLKLLTDDGREFILRITDGMTPDQFRKKFDEFGIKTFKQANMFAGKDERPWVESLMAKMRYDSKSEWSAPAQLPVVDSRAVVKFTLTSRYFRSIAKIAFHYLLTKMTQFRGDEGCFKPLRDFIMNESAKILDCALSCLPFPVFYRMADVDMR